MLSALYGTVQFHIWRPNLHKQVVPFSSRNMIVVLYYKKHRLLTLFQICHRQALNTAARKTAEIGNIRSLIARKNFYFEAL